MNIGKRIRFERLINRESKNTVIVPLDHGLSLGPIKGLENMPETIDRVVTGGANAVIVHKGIVPFGHRGYGKDVGLIVHLSGSTTLGNADDKVIVCGVKEAIKLGADAVSVHINLGSDSTNQQLKSLGDISRECVEWGLPLLAMMYPRGKGIDQFNEKAIKICARVGAELGADIIKTNYTGDAKSFREVVMGCPVPVVIAGGPKMKNDREFLKMVEDAINAGAKGVAIGRNIFQSENPEKVTRAISMIVHENVSSDTAYEFLKSE
jgi:fructose-bisphosphate aldolase/2-amino-3,7-dideoxy-D-threo-hept-6-ulosonate synthase